MTSGAVPSLAETDISVGGMTCAACVRRVEKKLSKLDGVVASVNGAGTDVAIGAADVTLVRGDIDALADAVRLSRTTLTTIRTNLAWAFGYNVVTVPLAMVGLLNPMLAAAAMSISSVLVVANSLRLRTWQPVPARAHQPRRRVRRSL